MGLINQVGYFKGYIVDGGLGQSSGGLPQEEWALKAEEVYDGDNQEYVPVDNEHDEITAYLILMSYKDKETKTAQQIKKITGWDGASYVDLCEMDLANVPLSFLVEENTYEGNTTLQVSWVAEPEAPPTRSVSKISKEDAQALQQRYAGILASTKAPTKAASAKSGKPAATEPETKTETEPKTTAKGKKTSSKTIRPIAPKTTTPVGKCSADDAYNTCHKLKRDDVTVEKLNELWTAAAAEVNKDEAKITEEQWFQIKENLLKAVSKV